MKIDRHNFYTALRAYFGKLSQSQVDGFEVILNEWENSKLIDRRWLAYMLATVWHECNKTMQPIAEYGKGINRPYGKRIKHSGIIYPSVYGFFYGRGYVQLTWFENYELLGRLLKIDLLKNPEKALEPKTAVKIMFEGMTKGSSSIGDFTGRSLEQYFNAEKEDPIGARKIINGTDKAELIKGYYIKFKIAVIGI